MGVFVDRIPEQDQTLSLYWWRWITGCGGRKGCVLTGGEVGSGDAVIAVVVNEVEKALRCQLLEALE